MDSTSIRPLEVRKVYNFLFNIFLTLHFIGNAYTSGGGPTDCKETGSHFDPANLDGNATDPHALPGEASDDERHVGALGNIFSENGVAIYDGYCSTEIELNGDDRIIGLGFTIHRDPDMGISASTTFGNAGPRVACGTIDAFD